MEDKDGPHQFTSKGKEKQAYEIKQRKLPQKHNSRDCVLEARVVLEPFSSQFSEDKPSN